MSALTRHSEPPFEWTEWQPEVLQLLESSHLVAWSDHARRRLRFAVMLAQFLQGQRDAEVCTLYGRTITDLDSFCHQLERSLPGPTLERRIDGPRGVTSLLRSRESFRGRPASKFRFYIWHDADVLLASDQRLFGLILDAMAGVGAEAEFVSDDLLLIHRAVVVGGPGLDAYAEDPAGQCQSWVCDGQGEPFWHLVSGVAAPVFMRYHIDTLLG